MHVNKRVYRRASTPSAYDSTSMDFDQSGSSAMSAITHDDEPFELSSRFDPTLKPTPEQHSAADSDMHEIQEYLNRLRMTSTSRFSTTIGPSSETKLCAMPKRKSSCQGLDYRASHNRLADFDDDEESGYFSDPASNGSGNTKSFNSFYSRDDASITSRSFSEGSARFRSSLASQSLDLGDIFALRARNDNSPKAAKRVSSGTLSAVSTKSAEESSFGGQTSKPSMSGEERFNAPCSKEKSDSITMPSRRGSTVS